MYPRILEPQPSITELITNREYWKPKILHFRGQKIVYDKDIRIGECLVCKRNGKAQWKPRTYLHHLFYDDSDPLAYTIEVCGKCHYKIDPNNRRQVNRSYGKYENTMSNVSRRYY
jgi:hypothetical protein